MRCQLVVLSIVVCMVSLTWMGVPARAEGPDVPVWTSGDFWEYEGTVQSEGTWVDLTMRMEVIGDEQVSIRGTTYDCYRLDSTVGMTAQGISFTITSKSWSRKSDLATVRAESTVLGETTTISYSPPMRTEWPLEVGLQWNGSSTTITNPPSGGETEETLNYSAEVESKTSITVPAGTFEAYEIRVTMTGTGDSHAYYAPQVGNEIRIRSSEAFGSIHPIDLVDYRFQSASEDDTDAFAGLVDNLWILILIIIVVVVVVAVLAMRKRRRPALPVEMPPQQPPQEPPPPPGW